MRWFVMPAAGSCLLTALKPGSADRVQIDLPVGAGPAARNLTQDVRAIQEALNELNATFFLSSEPLLVVDGICGPLTNAAIRKFQREQVGFMDGLIEPGKNTIRKMNEMFALIPLPTNADLKAKIAQAMPFVALSIHAAIANLNASLNPGGPGADLANDRLARHFRLDTLSPILQTFAKFDLRRLYFNFGTILLTPEAIGVATEDEFDLDLANPKKALTRVGGFFHPGETDPASGKRLDHIHLGRGFFAPEVTPAFAAHIILHEMGHFIGHSDGRVIDDFGRGWTDSPFIIPLPAEKRLTNADSCASFATECRTGSPNNPGFVQPAPGGLAAAR